MIFSKLWERYFFRMQAKIFILFLACFFGLYVIIDYASHTRALPHHQTQIPWKELSLYYSYIFISRAEILIPFALLIATIHGLTSLNRHNELVALLAGGVSLKKLLRPFLFTGLACTALLYFNEEYLLPSALTRLRLIEDSHKSAKRRNTSPVSVQNLRLEDGSLLVYQFYDTHREAFFDAYWVRSVDEIYKMKRLFPYLDTPEGSEVIHLMRQPSGELIQTAHYSKKKFLGIRFDSEKLYSAVASPELFSLTDLFQAIPGERKEHSEKESQALAAFYWRLAIPWLCLLAVIAPAPFCIRFSRQLPVFFIYVAGIFGLLAFYLILDAALIVAKRQVFTPFSTIVPIFGTVFTFFFWRYKLCTSG